MATSATHSPWSFSIARRAEEEWLAGSALSAAMVGFVTLIAAILRFHALTVKSFWLDEGISVQIARLPWPQFFFVLRHREANMGFYYLILRFWLLMGSGEGFIRGLAALFSIATIPLVFLLGARLFGRGTGLLAAWLLAINAYHVRYAQEARSYALVVFFAVLASWLLIRNLQERSSVHWGAYSVVCALCVYSHFFGALVIVAHAVSLAFLPRNNLPLRDLARSARWFAYMMVPVGAVVAFVGTGSMRWIPPIEARTVLNFFLALAGNGGGKLLLFEGVAVGVAVLAAWSDRRGNARTEGVWAYVFVGVWLFFPVLLVIAVSMTRPFFLARYLNPCLPALMLLIAAGIARTRPPLLAWVLGATISVLSLLGTTSYYRQDFDLGRDDWRAATSYVIDRALPGDGVFFYLNFGRLPFEFYESQRRPAPAWPEALVSANGADWGYRDSLFSYLADAMRDAGPGNDRVWLVLDLNTDTNGQPNRETEILRAVYGKGRHLVEEKRISKITVLLFARDATESARASPQNP